MRQTAAVKLNRVHHIAIIAADYQASKRFHCDVLGCELLTEVYRMERESHTGRVMMSSWTPKVDRWSSTKADRRRSREAAKSPIGYGCVDSRVDSRVDPRAGRVGSTIERGRTGEQADLARSRRGAEPGPRTLPVVPGDQ